MRIIGVLLIFAALISFSCKKDEAPSISFDEQLALDSAIIANYLEANNITNVVTDRTGYVKYVIHDDYSGVTPILSDSVEVSYSGRLLDSGVEFDSGEHSKFLVNGLITGWKIVLTEIQEGDSVTVYIPSGYAYGANGSGDKIPANANLIFDMRLHRAFQ